MGNGSDVRRRMLGLICLTVPVAMLILGQTVFKSALDGMAFVVYWLVCLCFTSAAIVIALMDLRSVRRQTREEARELLEKTLEEIERRASEKPAGPDRVG
jgi:hypothetical protein